MQEHTEYTSLVTSERERRANFHTLLSCVLPRPIAFVSTISADGVHNLAPFSFFNGVGSSPPAVIFSPCTRADGTDKDTLNNLRQCPEMVVHVVPHAIHMAMNQASALYPPEVDEFQAAGFTPLESLFVRPPRVAQCPVQMECRLLDIVPVGDLYDAVAHGDEDTLLQPDFVSGFRSGIARRSKGAGDALRQNT